MKKAGSQSDPLWFKDAIIYEAHIRAFYDSNGDGIGDIPGLTQKLDYLVDLGITCIWVLPFFPSPLRDDGYDIADYTSVNPIYGTLEDFQIFLDAAHLRGLQVVIELVINHTSDQHPWFQRARLAPPDSPERNYYVWSDTDKRFPDARIIFTDTERSNWTWDPEAKAYYWHRFFSHQPDLNFDNPVVLEEMIQAMRFWLDMGVDGLRLDAIPYLVEREGTNCENLPETHAIIKQIRAALDEGYESRFLLAEANQWPADVRAYFGDGDECHMAYHFPLMPRIFMAVRLEDRHPIIEILSKTPEIPEMCQWGMFLRNHDELTLEMVTDEERDYMYNTYSADPRMRVNIGIRRRLAPLMDNDRRRVELLHSLLFSFPGTPVLYYGDEIGMGDNIYLDDRNGVRTPMQWSPDRNAGFSRADPARLYFPVIMDPVYGYQAVNVEAQQASPSSLYHWMRRMLALHKRLQVFGRGSLSFLHPDNRAVLAYLRSYEDTTILCVANLSRFAQAVELDLPAFRGSVPVEMLGLQEFPRIQDDAYPITLAPYGFYWFELKPAETRETGPEDDFLVCKAHWTEVLEEATLLARLENTHLPAFLPVQRWFGAKAKSIDDVKVMDVGVSSWEMDAVALVIIEINYVGGGKDTYSLPLAFVPAVPGEKEPDERAIVCRMLCGETSGWLVDGTAVPHAGAWFLEALRAGTSVKTWNGVVRFEAFPALMAWTPGPEPLLARRLEGEQSNTSILYRPEWILKLLRRLEEGQSPDEEVGEFLTRGARFDRVPALAGVGNYERNGSEPTTLCILHQLIDNQGDAWANALNFIDRYLEMCGLEQRQAAENGEISVAPEGPEADIPEQIRLTLDYHLAEIRLLGQRTAEMHCALSGDADEPAFAPEATSPADLDAWSEAFIASARRALALLKTRLATLTEEVADQAVTLLSRRAALLSSLAAVRDLSDGGRRIRIHGDYHLGQVLVRHNDFFILDFEGEPSRTIAERRAKWSPLKDVAGMLRSFSYAASAALLQFAAREPESTEDMRPWVEIYERETVNAFLDSYFLTVEPARILPEDADARARLLDAFLLDKAFYELEYELNNRPDWVEIPMRGILRIAG